MYSSDDSEFDYEAEEEEISLYTWLYFGDNSPIDARTSSEKEGIKSQRNTVEECEQLIKSIPTIQNEENILNTDCSQSVLINTQDSSILLDASRKKPDSPRHESSEKIFSNENSVKPLRNNELVNNNKIVAKKLRRRNLSHCSIDSVSGREPLDSLYCNGVSDEETLDTVQELSFENSTRDSWLNVGDRPNVMNANSDEESRCNMVINKNQETKPKQSLKNSISESSDEELCILPPPSPKRIETVTLECESNDSDKSIQIVNLLNNKTRNKIKCNSLKLKKDIRKKSENIIVVSSGSSCSSDDSDIDSLEASRFSVPLTMNLCSRMKFESKRRALKHTKSQAIFSKGKPQSEREPSCPTWTPEMTSLYDSDYSDEFSVEEVHRMQSDSLRNWEVCHEDLPYCRSKRQRYFEERCTRCKEYGHSVKKCPRIPHCLFCASTTHVYINQCPQNCCLRCGGMPHGYCYLTSHQRICNECGNLGHDSSLCPDVWRRYHATTSGSIPVIPDVNNNTKKRTPYCYNCAKKGHFGHECRMNNSRKYSFVSTEIFSYDPPCAFRQDAAEDDDVQVLPPSTNFAPEVNKPSPLFTERKTNGQRSRQRQKFVRKVLDLSRMQLKFVVGKKQSGLKKIKQRTNVEVNARFSRNKTSKLIIDGIQEDVEAACSMVSSMLPECSEKDPKELKSCVKKTKKVAKTPRKVALKSKENKSNTNKNLPLDAPRNSRLRENTSETTTSARSEESLPRANSSPQKELGIFRVPLPSERLAAINAIKALVRRIPQWKKRYVKFDTLDRFIRYFKTRTMSECDAKKRREFLNQMQRLSYVLYTNCRLGKAKQWLMSLRQYKNVLVKETDQFVGAELHEEISSIYCNIANPSLEDLPNLLNLARSRIKTFIAKIADEEKRGIKHSKKRKNVKKIRIRGDTSQLQFNP